MRFSRDLCLQLDAALSRHWLETDGLGGYASSTLIHCATSRFHGLLVAPSQEQPERHLFLSRFEETIHGEGQAFPLSEARYGGAFGPGGHHFVETCTFDVRPSFTYRIGHVSAVREVQMVHGRPAVLVRYRITGQRKPVRLELSPFTPYRAANGLTFMNDAIHEDVQPHPNGIRLRPYDGLPELHITLSREGGFEAKPCWYRGFEYGDDLARGYDGHEDQWAPGHLWAEFDDGDELIVAASIGEPLLDPASAWAAEAARRPEPQLDDDAPIDVRAVLDRAAEHFLYRTQDGRPGVIAGFPWFGEWGRDTLIALPGLTLARGQVERCGEILAGLAPFFRDGRLPNVFARTPDASDYKAVDPSLWYGRAARLYGNAAGPDDPRYRDEIVPLLVDVAEQHRNADSMALTCDVAGLLRTGDPDVATTWMDAVIDGHPVTPRHGAAVEINALWYSLLDTVVRALEHDGSRSAKKKAKDWSAFRDKVGASFVDRFWLPTKNRLADRVADGVQDDTVRPNMVIAAALEASPLTPAQRHAVVEVSRVELLTSRGLRTLSPRYLRYRGRYGGDVVRRDDAYHQGTVWPWLLGFHVEAELRAGGSSTVVRSRLRELLDGFAEHLSEHGVGQVSEVFDGDPPHRPGGCFAQAWSVAELLRAYALLDPGGAS